MMLLPVLTALVSFSTLAGTPAEDIIQRRLQKRFQDARPARFADVMISNLPESQNGYNGLWKCSSRTAEKAVLESTSVYPTLHFGYNTADILTSGFRDRSRYQDGEYYEMDSGELQSTKMSGRINCTLPGYEGKYNTSKMTTTIRRETNGNLIGEVGFDIPECLSFPDYPTPATAAIPRGNLKTALQEYFVCEATKI